jgi:hypothetical protein
MVQHYQQQKVVKTMKKYWEEFKARIVMLGVMGFALLLRAIKRVYSHDLQY